jgi:hypothetical protein
MTIGNLIDDVAAGRVHAVIHSGDHCYQLVNDDYQKGDAYLDVHSSVLASTPWAPGFGNHEYLGEHADRLARRRRLSSPRPPAAALETPPAA